MGKKDRSEKDREDVGTNQRLKTENEGLDSQEVETSMCPTMDITLSSQVSISNERGISMSSFLENNK